MTKRRERYLKPLIGRDHEFRHATFDIETEDKDKPLTSIRTRFEMGGIYDGENYQLCLTLSDLVDQLCHKKFRGFIIYAHNAGRFDFQILIPELIRKNKRFKMIAQGARIVEIKIYSGKNLTSLRDSFALLPFSLARLCKTFSPQTQKLTGSIDFASERVDQGSQSHRAYLEADCRSLWEILDMYKRLPYVSVTGPKLTRSSTALAGWRTTLKEPIRCTPDFVQNFCRKALAGGRTEIFKTIQGAGGGCYDKNSLYPAMMLKPLPLEFISETRNIDDFGYHEIIAEIPEMYLPVLWVKYPKLLFPTGIIRGTYFSEEIKLAVAHGAKIIKHIRGMKFTQSDQIFNQFIMDNYCLRLENPKGPINIIAKDNMNHCYGKTSERELKKSMQRLDPNNPRSWPKRFSHWHSDAFFQRWGLVTVEKKRRSPHMLCHIGGAIVAWGRISMYQDIYHPFQDSLYYTDTDSGYLDRAIPVSEKLGELKLEFPVKEAFFLLPKCYYVDTGLEFNPDEPDKTGIIRKIKGFPRKALEQFTLQQFKDRDLKYRKLTLLSMRESLIRNNEFISEGGRMKEIRASYDKRKTLPNGTTVPWQLNREGVIING